MVYKKTCHCSLIAFVAVNLSDGTVHLKGGLVHLPVNSLSATKCLLYPRQMARSLQVTMPSEGLTATPLRWQGKLFGLQTSCHMMMLIRMVPGVPSFGNWRCPCHLRVWTGWNLEQFFSDYNHLAGNMTCTSPSPSSQCLPVRRRTGCLGCCSFRWSQHENAPSLYISNLPVS